MKRNIRNKAGAGGAGVPKGECALITLGQQPLTAGSQVTLRIQKTRPPYAKKTAGVYCTPQINISPKSGGSVRIVYKEAVNKVTFVT